jgi:hypothetical protein
MYIFGDSGVGKTVTSLHFPAPAVIDLEKGTDFYADNFDFVRLQTNDIEEITKAIDELIADPSGVKTLVIDPFTIYWDLIQEKHLKRLKVKKGNPNYVLQPIDYKAIKNELKSIVNKLIAVDLNIIVTARSKPEYASDTGEFMKVIGVKPDGPKELPFLFDVVLQLNVDDDGVRKATVIKDRTNRLPLEPFEFTYHKMIEFLDIKDLEREPVVLRGLQELDRMSNRNTTITFEGKEIKTAGITAETLTAIKEAVTGLNENDIREKLNDDYSVQSFLDLREDEAKLLLKDLTNTLQ